MTGKQTDAAARRSRAEAGPLPAEDDVQRSFSEAHGTGTDPMSAQSS
jgi:hypothetical protein